MASYFDEADSADIYGHLYTWAAAMNGAPSSMMVPSGTQGVCPIGWHMPSDGEWGSLITYLGGNTASGPALKEAGSQHWACNPCCTGTNISGFTALPGGYRDAINSFQFIRKHGQWWSSTELSPTHVFTESLKYDQPST